LFDLGLINDFVAGNPEVPHIDHQVFKSCYPKIKPWFDLSLLASYLFKYGVVKNSSDMYVLTSSHLPPQDRNNSLVKLVEEAGPDGFMLLYMSLRDSSTESIGHQDAVQELDHHGMFIHESDCLT
jgi:hypothetical protein